MLSGVVAGFKYVMCGWIFKRGSKNVVQGLQVLSKLNNTIAKYCSLVGAVLNLVKHGDPG